MKITGYCCLTVYDEALDFEDIKKNLDFEPTDITYKGESNKIGTSPGDVWAYDVAFEEEDDIDEEINKFVSFIMKYKYYICHLSKTNNVRLWCDIYAYNAQSKIFFSPKTIDTISKLGIGFDIEIYLHEEDIEEK